MRREGCGGGGRIILWREKIGFYIEKKGFLAPLRERMKWVKLGKIVASLGKVEDRL